MKSILLLIALLVGDSHCRGQAGFEFYLYDESGVGLVKLPAFSGEFDFRGRESVVVTGIVRSPGIYYIADKVRLSDLVAVGGK